MATKRICSSLAPFGNIFGSIYPSHTSAAAFFVQNLCSLAQRVLVKPDGPSSVRPQFESPSSQGATEMFAVWSAFSEKMSFGQTSIFKKKKHLLTPAVSEKIEGVSLKRNNFIPIVFDVSRKQHRSV